MRSWGTRQTPSGKAVVPLEEPRPARRDQAERDGLGVRSSVRVDVADLLGRVGALPEPRVGHAYRLVLHAHGVPACLPSSIGGLSLLRNRAIFCLLALFTCRPIGTFLVNPQLRSRNRAYCIVYSIRHSAGTVANDVAQAVCPPGRPSFLLF